MPRARRRRPARLSALNVRTVAVVLQETTRVASRPTAVSKFASATNEWPGHGVLFATLKNELEPALAIDRHIPGRDVLGRAVDDDIHCAEKVLQTSLRRQICGSKRFPGLRSTGEQRHALRGQDARAPVRRDIRDALEGHVALRSDSVGDPFSDDAVAVYGHTSLAIHRELSGGVAKMDGSGGGSLQIADLSR